MTQKSIEQRIADTQNRLLRLKSKERRQRTHKLIVFGSQFADVISDWQKLDDATRVALRAKIIEAIRAKADLSGRKDQPNG